MPTPDEQAESEAASKYQKKLDSGYTEDINNVSEARAAFFKPMLAKEYFTLCGWDKDLKAYTKPDKVKFPAICQSKLDGLRFEVDKDKGLSRKGKPFGGGFHVLETLKPVFEKYPDLRLDGELYNESLKDDFNSLVSLIKKSEEHMDDEKREAIKAVVQYHIYDVPSIDGLGLDAPFLDRMSRFVQVITYEFPEVIGVIQLVSSISVRNHQEVESVYEELLDQGYEGAMLRYNLGYEEDKRTWNLLKVKPFSDAEFELLEVSDGVGAWAGKAKQVLVRLPGGIISGAGVKGSEGFCRDKFKNRENYIGKTVTVSYQGLTPAGKLRFGVVKDWDRESYE